MNHISDNLVTLTRLIPSANEETNTTSLNGSAQDFDKFVANAFVQASDKAMQYKSSIYEISQNPNLTSDPEALYRLQVYLGEYTNYVNLVSTLARKSVSTVETLVKAQ